MSPSKLISVILSKSIRDYTLKINSNHILKINSSHTSKINCNCTLNINSSFTLKINSYQLTKVNSNYISNLTLISTIYFKLIPIPFYTYLSILLATSNYRVCGTCFSRTNCSLSRYNAKGKLDCFNCKTGVFLRLFTPMFTKESNYNSRF